MRGGRSGLIEVELLGLTVIHSSLQLFTNLESSKCLVSF